MAKKKTLHHLTREPLSESAFGASFEEVVNGSDRQAALVMGSIVDMTLAKALCARFVLRSEEHRDAIFFNGGAPLGSFAARIAMGRAMGIYGDKMEAVLNSVRKIRNVFAHSVNPISFKHELIAAECEKLFDIPVRTEIAQNVSANRARYLGASTWLMELLEEQKLKYISQGKFIDNCDIEWEVDGAPIYCWM